MSRKGIADFLTIEAASWTFTKFERDRVIEIISGGVQILDLARAKARAIA